jgi:hypothetical protein
MAGRFYFRICWWTILTLAFVPKTFALYNRRPELFPAERRIVDIFADCAFYRPVDLGADFVDSEANTSPPSKPYTLSLPTTNTVPGSMIPRFSQCSVKVFHPTFLLSNVTQETSWEAYPAHPTFGILYLRRAWFSSPSHRSTIGNSLESIPSLHTSTMYFALVLDDEFWSDSFYIICLPCTKDIADKLVPVSGKTMNVQRITSAWREVHMNLRGQPVLYPDKDTLHIRSDCVQTKAFRSFCPPSFLSNMYNGTLIFDLNKYQKAHAVIRNTLLEFLTEEKSTHGHGEYEYEWMQNGNLFEPFTFVLVLDRAAYRRTVNVNSPLGYEIENWKNFTTLGFSFFLIIGARFKDWIKAPKVKKWTVSKWVFGWAEMYEIALAPLWDQGLAGRAFKRKLEKLTIFRLLLVTWSLCTIVLCGLYKGTLVSFLSKQVPIPSPTTLRELVLESDLPILTGDTYNDEDGNGSQREMMVPLSLLKEIVRRHIAVKRLSESDSNLYQTLKAKAFYVTMSKAQVVAAYQARVNIGNETNPPLDNYFLPRSFALIGFQSGINHFSNMMETFPNIFLVKNSYVDSLVSLKIVMALSKNYFGMTIFPRGYAALDESGINGVWAGYRDKLFHDYDGRYLNCIFSRGSEKTRLERYNQLCKNKFYVFKTFSTRQNYSPRRLRKGITLPMFLQFSSLYIFGVICSTIIFIIEVLSVLKGKFWAKNGKQFVLGKEIGLRTTGKPQLKLGGRRFTKFRHNLPQKGRRQIPEIKLFYVQ